MHVTVLSVLLITGVQPCVDCQRQPAAATQDCRCRSCNQVACEPDSRGCCMVWRCLPAFCRPVRRYPAVPSYYCNRPYNYRRAFDYPWHASPHRPQGLFPFFDGRPLGEEVPTPHPRPGGVPHEPLPIVPGFPSPPNDRTH